MSLKFMVDSSFDGADRVHIFDLNFRSELCLSFFSDGNVDVATHLSLFHVGVRDIIVP